MKSIFLNCFLILIFCYSISYSNGFLKTDNQKIVDGSGQEIILRGMGLGGWMLQEGYMLQTSSFANAQHEIKEKIIELVGEEGNEEFYDAWLENFCQKADIDSLAAWGFNSVRLPLHYNLFTLPIEDEPVPGEHTWLDKGFELTDDLLSWCADNEIYLILDLHAAPGGQGADKAISDYDESKPSLWESSANRAKTVALWRKLAERYADETWIGGYDLINETNWNLAGNSLLKTLYTDITEAIREVDSNHIIFIEGNWWANDFTGLTPPWDDNMVYSFHKYWSHNDRGSIQWMLNIRAINNVPIWCGESGENSNVWFRDAIYLFESFGIGWAWWPMKKVESVSGPLSIPKSQGYQFLLDYWERRVSSKPSESFARQALLQFAEDCRIENCTYHKDIIDAMFRQVTSNEAVPYRKHELPGILPMAEFDLGRHGTAYSDNDVVNYQVSTGSYSDWNAGWAFRNDGVDIESSHDESGSPYSIGWINDGEWLNYTVDIKYSDKYDIHFRVASATGGGQLQLLVDNQVKVQSLVIPNSGGWYLWKDVTVSDIELTSGKHTLRVNFLQSGFNINQMQFVAKSAGNGGGGPEDIVLGQNYPNPFNKSTVIPFSIPANTDGKVIIYDQQGRVVRKIAASGLNSVTWNGKNDRKIPSGSGVFYYRIKTGKSSKTKKMLLLN